MRPAALCPAGQTNSKRTKTTSTGTSFKKKHKHITWNSNQRAQGSRRIFSTIAAQKQSTLFAYEREKRAATVQSNMMWE